MRVGQLPVGGQAARIVLEFARIGVVVTSNRNPPLALTSSSKLLILNEYSLGARQFLWGQLEETKQISSERHMKSTT